MAIVRIILFFCATILITSDLAAARVIDIFTYPLDQAYQPLQLMSSMPRANDVLVAAPAQITLTFSMPIALHGAAIKVYGMYGNQLNDSPVMLYGKTLSADLPELPQGKYTVKWRVRCDCDADDEISDVFHFTIQ